MLWPYILWNAFRAASDHLTV